MLLGEVVSDPGPEQDRYRMLLQAISLVRMASHIRKDTVVMAIYVNDKNVATRYVVHLDEQKKVRVS